MFISITVSSDQDDNRGTIWTEEGILHHLDWSRINNQQQALISDRIWKHHGISDAAGDMLNFAVNMIECQDEIIY